MPKTLTEADFQAIADFCFNNIQQDLPHMSDDEALNPVIVLGVINDMRHHRPSLRARQVVATPGALAACSPAYLAQCLAQHASGDWGCVCPEDGQSNDEALFAGGRLLSAYPIDPTKPSKGYGDNTLWIITEGDRSATTFLLPDEY